MKQIRMTKKGLSQRGQTSGQTTLSLSEERDNFSKKIAINDQIQSYDNNLTQKNTYLNDKLQKRRTSEYVGYKKYEKEENEQKINLYKQKRVISGVRFNIEIYLLRGNMIIHAQEIAGIRTKVIQLIQEQAFLFLENECDNDFEKLVLRLKLENNLLFLFQYRNNNQTNQQPNQRYDKLSQQKYSANIDSYNISQNSPDNSKLTKNEGVSDNQQLINRSLLNSSRLVEEYYKNDSFNNYEEDLRKSFIIDSRISPEIQEIKQNDKSNNLDQIDNQIEEVKEDSNMIISQSDIDDEANTAKKAMNNVDAIEKNINYNIEIQKYEMPNRKLTLHQN